MVDASSATAKGVVASIAAGTPMNPAAMPATGVTPAANQTAQPLWTIGAGWYFYVYLNSGDINWLRGLGYRAASAAICAWLTPTVVGAVACAVVAYIIWTIVSPLGYVNNPGYCLEVKLNWGSFSLAGVKWVKRNC